MSRLVQAGAAELQAWCVVARLIALFCHCLQGWQAGPMGPVRSGRNALAWDVGFLTWRGALLTRGSLKVTQYFTRSPKASKHRLA